MNFPFGSPLLHLLCNGFPKKYGHRSSQLIGLQNSTMKLDNPVSILVIPDSGAAPFIAGGAENIAAARKLLANPEFLKQTANLTEGGAASAFFVQKSQGFRLLPVTLFQATPFPDEQTAPAAVPAPSVESKSPAAEVEAEVGK